MIVYCIIRLYIYILYSFSVFLCVRLMIVRQRVVALCFVLFAWVVSDSICFIFCWGRGVGSDFCLFISFLCETTCTGLIACSSKLFLSCYSLFSQTCLGHSKSFKIMMLWGSMSCFGSDTFGDSRCSIIVSQVRVELLHHLNM